jgi:hypothetical protein
MLSRGACPDTLHRQTQTHTVAQTDLAILRCCCGVRLALLRVALSRRLATAGRHVPPANRGPFCATFPLALLSVAAAFAHSSSGTYSCHRNMAGQVSSGGSRAGKRAQTVGIKVKVILVTGPQGCETSRRPHFLRQPGRRWR